MTAVMGYADQLAVRPGETINFKVSCKTPSYDATIVRLFCGDDRPDGPGYRATTIVDAAVNGRYEGHARPIACGSYLRVPPHPRLGGLTAFSFAVLIWPTLPGVGEQVIFSLGAEQGGPTLDLDTNGRLRLSVAGKSVVASRPVVSRHWYRVLAAAAPDGGLMLHWEPLMRSWGEAGAETLRVAAPVRPLVPAGLLLIGATITAGRVCNHFNGKVEAPRLLARAAEPEELAGILAGGSAVLRDPALVAAWDFARGISTNVVHDAGPHGIDGVCVNLPARGVTGANWSGRSLAWTDCAEEYAAIHLHDDDLYDCEWPTDFAWIVPENLLSGIYAARLCTERGDEDHVPFFVLAPRGAPRSKIALLAATTTYLAYANSHDAYEDPVAEVTHGTLPTLSATDLFLMKRRDLGVSTYDLHHDGSGAFYSSRMRPILNTRPLQPLWGFNADLHITDFLDALGQDCDIIDDETLHREGVALLAGYTCIITGSHPEYVSRPMMAAFEQYLGQGGRLIYLGGNGFYWRTGWHPELPGVIEVRRGPTGTRCWMGEPGEDVLSTTGEIGGLWRMSGHAPQRLVGVGFVSQGFDAGAPYHRLPESHDPRARFIFDGIEQEVIGDFGPFGGAAALELDAADGRRGTPAHALRLATSRGHSNLYLLTPEELAANLPGIDGIDSDAIRADMVFFETPAGGAVFSTGSIGWAAALANQGYANPVARITANVLRRFLDTTPFQEPPRG